MSREVDAVVAAVGMIPFFALSGYYSLRRRGMMGADDGYLGPMGPELLVCIVLPRTP